MKTRNLTQKQIAGILNSQNEVPEKFTYYYVQLFEERTGKNLSKHFKNRDAAIEFWKANPTSEKPRTESFPYELKTAV